MPTPKNNVPEDKAHTPKEHEESGGLNILGQSWIFPKTIPGTVSMCFLCVAAVAFAYVILHAPLEQLRTVAFALVKVSPGGEQKKERNTVSYGFWTPSEKTKSQLQALGDAIPDNKKWVLKINVTDKTLNDFGEALRNAGGVEGYRRNEIWGQGRKVNDKTTPAIHGWWWTVSAKKKFTIEDLSKFYTKHWENTDAPLYIEVFDASGKFK